MILSANCISLAVVVVELSKPATPVGVPVESKMSVLSGETGTAKFAWFKMLKTSARNCTLKDSDIFLTWLFLNTEKSRFIVPGPVRMLRPALPRRLKHWSEVASPPLQFACQKARLGAVGTAKHSVLM